MIPVVVVPAGLIPVPNTDEGVVPVGVVVVGVVVDGVVVLGVVPVGVVVGVVPVGVVVGVVPVGVVGVVPVWLNKAKHHHININLKTMLHYDKIKKEKKKTIHNKKLNRAKTLSYILTSKPCFIMIKL